MSGTTSPTKPVNAVTRDARGDAEWADDGYHLAKRLRRQINHVFPTHSYFLLGQITLYSFRVLLLSGTYRAWFFDPSKQEVTYNGSFDNLRGVSMSRAFE